MEDAALPLAPVIGFLFALVRTTAFMALAPPFNNRSIPRRIKLGVAMGISLALAHKLPADNVSLDGSYILANVATQLITGLALGMITNVLFAAVGMAGQFIDLFGGFTLAMSMDPMLNAQTSIFGRFYSLIATVMLFAINGHLMVVKGFLTSFEAIPITGISIETFIDMMLKNVSMLMIAAVEIAGPLLAAYFLTEVALGLLGKAAPQMNILQFGFPLKIFLTLLLVGAALPLIPGAMHNLTNDVLQSGFELLRPEKGAGA